jgi:hypothetical protein
MLSWDVSNAVVNKKTAMFSRCTFLVGWVVCGCKQERAVSVGKQHQYWRIRAPSPAKQPYDRLSNLLHTMVHILGNFLCFVKLLHQKLRQSIIFAPFGI